MAEGKKSFILYTDYITTIEELSDEEAGLWVKHLFRYVNDKDPQLNDRIVKLAFEPIKQQLKRDLKDWEGIKVKRAEAGKIGGQKSAELRKQNEANQANAAFAVANSSKSKQTQANQAVTVTVNDNVTDTVTEIKEGIVMSDDKSPTHQEILIDKQEKMKSRDLLFYKTLAPYVDQYGKELLRNFYNYWKEPNKSKTKMKFELESTWDLESRLSRWEANNSKFKGSKKSTQDQEMELLKSIGL